MSEHRRGKWPFSGEFPAMSANELLLRRLLWLRHHGTTVGLYGDDGEMQCGKCMLDFRRMSVREIEARFFQLGIAAVDEHWTVAVLREGKSLFDGR